MQTVKVTNSDGCQDKDKTVINQNVYNTSNVHWVSVLYLQLEPALPPINLRFFTAA